MATKPHLKWRDEDVIRRLWDDEGRPKPLSLDATIQDALQKRELSVNPGRVRMNLLTAYVLAKQAAQPKVDLISELKTRLAATRNAIEAIRKAKGPPLSHRLGTSRTDTRPPASDWSETAQNIMAGEYGLRRQEQLLSEQLCALDTGKVDDWIVTFVESMAFTWLTLTGETPVNGHKFEAFVSDAYAALGGPVERATQSRTIRAAGQENTRASIGGTVVRSVLRTLNQRQWDGVKAFELDDAYRAPFLPGAVLLSADPVEVLLSDHRIARIRPPTAAEVQRIGFPYRLSVDGDGSISVEPDGRRIIQYLQLCDIDPELLEELRLADGMALQSTLLSFFPAKIEPPQRLAWFIRQMRYFSTANLAVVKRFRAVVRPIDIPPWQIEMIRRAAEPY